MKTEKTNLYAVYGTLKKGYGNHRILDNEHVEFVGTTTTPKIYDIYHLGGFPGVKRNGNTEVEVEIYRVNSKEVESRLDALEGYRSDNPTGGLYDKEVVETDLGPANIYIYNWEVNEENKVENGKWKSRW